MATFALDYPYSRMQCKDGALKIYALSNPKLYKGRTYYVKVIYRGLGDGSCSKTKCASISFIAHWNNWGTVRRYGHNSATAYEERYSVVSWQYSFTVDSDVQPDGTNLYAIVDYAWANGYDDQHIELYFFKYWDSAGNVYNERGEDCTTMNLRQGNATYSAVFASTIKYTTPSFYFRKYGKTHYIPLLEYPASSDSTSKSIIEGNYTYVIQYRIQSYYNPKFEVRYNGKNYYLPQFVTKTNLNVDIPAGTYTPSAFYNLITKYISSPISSPGGTMNRRQVQNAFTVTVNGKTCSVPAGRYIMLRNVGSSHPFGFVVTIFGGINTHANYNEVKNFSTYGMYGTATNIAPSAGISMWNNFSNYSITIATGIKFV